MNQEHKAKAAADRREPEHGAEWSDTLPALFRSEGFFEDLLPAPAPAPAPARRRARHARRVAYDPSVLSQMLASMLGMRRA